MKVYAVIGGHNYGGEDFNTLQLFYCKSTAEKYKETLSLQCDYVKMEFKTVDFYSFILNDKSDTSTTGTRSHSLLSHCPYNTHVTHKCYSTL